MTTKTEQEMSVQLARIEEQLKAIKEQMPTKCTDHNRRIQAVESDQKNIVKALWIVFVAAISSFAKTFTFW